MKSLLFSFYYSDHFHLHRGLFFLAFMVKMSLRLLNNGKQSVILADAI